MIKYNNEGQIMQVNKSNILDYLSFLKTELSSKGIEQIALFGSYAKDSQNDYSDIDIAIKKDKAILEKVDYTPIYVLDNGNKAENRFELTDMKQLALDYANGDTSRISRKTYDSIISKLEKLQSTVNSK